MTVAVSQEPNKHQVQTHDMRVLPVVKVNRRSIRVTRRNEGVLPPQSQSSTTLSVYASDSLGHTIPPGDIEDPGNARTDFPNASEEHNLRNISRHSRVLFERIHGMQGIWRVASSIDLKQLNHHIDAPHIRMHTISSVLSTIEKRRLHVQNRSAGCVLHVLIHPQSIDALSQDWQGRSMYMFPPFLLLNKVIQKLRTTQTGEVILIGPWWPSQPWFPHLLRLSVDHLLRFFQYRRDLLSQQGYISSGKSYHLHAWRLLCSTTEQQDFQGRSLSLPQLLHVGDPPQIEYTMTGCYASLPGLQGEDLIRLSRVTGPV